MPRIYGQPGEARAAGSPSQFGRILGWARTPRCAPAGCTFDPRSARQGLTTAGPRGRVILRFDVRDLERTAEAGGGGSCPAPDPFLLGFGCRRGRERGPS